MSLQKQIFELAEQINSLQEQKYLIESLQKQLEIINQQLQANTDLFYAILFGVAATIGVALYFVVQSLVSKGIEKGIARKINNPEFLGSLMLSSNKDDTKNVKLVKLDDSPTINIMTDKDNANLTVNHVPVLTSDYNECFITPLYKFCCFPETTKMTFMKYGDYYIVNIILSEMKRIDVEFINKGETIAHIISNLKPDYDIYFKGYCKNENKSESFDLCLTSDAKIISMQQWVGKVESLNATLIYITKFKKME